MASESSQDVSYLTKALQDEESDDEHDFQCPLKGYCYKCKQEHENQKNGLEAQEDGFDSETTVIENSSGAVIDGSLDSISSVLSDAAFEECAVEICNQGLLEEDDIVPNQQFQVQENVENGSLEPVFNDEDNQQSDEDAEFDDVNQSMIAIPDEEDFLHVDFDEDELEARNTKEFVLMSAIFSAIFLLGFSIWDVLRNYTK